MTKDHGYPEDVRAYDDDPRSPFHKEGSYKDEGWYERKLEEADYRRDEAKDNWRETND